MADLSTKTFAEGLIEITTIGQIGPSRSPDPERDRQVMAVAEHVAAFIAGASTTLDIAVYDFRLSGPAADAIVAALQARAAAGVTIRVVYDPSTASHADVPGGDTTVAAAGALGKPPEDPAFLDRVSAFAQAKPVKGFKALMHNKYIIRDALDEDAAVLLGSANFTLDSWGLQENNIVAVRSQPLSTYYATDFLQLWVRGKITHSTGYHDTGSVVIGGVPVTVAFTPGESSTVVQGIVGAIERARTRVTVAAMVMSSGPVLAAVSEAMDRGLVVAGLYDGPQMDTVLYQWASAGIGADKANTWAKIAAALSRKNSTPYRPTSPHDFMHAKLIVADDVVVTGSFNFSNHARDNAENTIFVSDSAIADHYDGVIRGWAERYR